MHKVEQLRRQRLQESSKPFLSRGSRLKRCDNCQLGKDHCICQQLKKDHSHCDLILIMHRNELLKPSNSGRLIADTLPDITHAYIWSRTEPEPELLALLNQSNRQCLLVFPPKEDDPQESFNSLAVKQKLDGEWRDKKITLIMLDGTWKQARKMHAKSDYLKSIPILLLCEQDIADCAGKYAMRQAHAPSLSSTCEAAIIALNGIGEQQASQTLQQNFTHFNNAYVASRGNIRLKKVR